MKYVYIITIIFFIFGKFEPQTSKQIFAVVIFVFFLVQLLNSRQKKQLQKKPIQKNTNQKKNKKINTYDNTLKPKYHDYIQACWDEIEKK